MASPKLTEAQRKLRELLVQSGVTEQRASHLAQSIWRRNKVARLVSFGAGPKLRTEAERLCAELPALPAARPDTQDEARARGFADTLEQHRLRADAARRDAEAERAAVVLAHAALATDRSAIGRDFFHVQYMVAEMTRRNNAVLARRVSDVGARREQRSRDALVLAGKVLSNAALRDRGGTHAGNADSARPALLAELRRVLPHADDGDGACDVALLLKHAAAATHGEVLHDFNSALQAATTRPPPAPPPAPPPPAKTAAELAAEAEAKKQRRAEAEAAQQAHMAHMAADAKARREAACAFAADKHHRAVAASSGCVEELRAGQERLKKPHLDDKMLALRAAERREASLLHAARREPSDAARARAEEAKAKVAQLACVAAEPLARLKELREEQAELEQALLAAEAAEEEAKRDYLAAVDQARGRWLRLGREQWCGDRQVVQPPTAQAVRSAQYSAVS